MATFGLVGLAIKGLESANCSHTQNKASRQQRETKQPHWFVKSTSDLGPLRPVKIDSFGHIADGHKIHSEPIAGIQLM